MIYTLRLKAALRFSVKTHEVYQKQKRKGKDIPYITHPLTVGLILSQARAAEDVVVAGILHDTIEDSVPHKKVTTAMLRRRFGPHVAGLVDSVTERKKSEPWETRKRQALAHIAQFSQGSVLVKSADVLSNVRELLDDYGRDGNKVFQRFNAPKDKVLNNTLEVIKALLLRWPGNPLAGDLRDVQKGLKSIL